MFSGELEGENKEISPVFGRKLELLVMSPLSFFLFNLAALSSFFVCLAENWRGKTKRYHLYFMDGYIDKFASSYVYVYRK